MPNHVVRFQLSNAGSTEAQGINVSQALWNARIEKGENDFLTGAQVIVGEAVVPMGSTVVGSICHDYSGNLYLTDSVQHAVYKIREDNTLTLIAGLPGTAGDLVDVSIKDPATGRTRAAFRNPNGICCDRSGNIYVCDTGNNKIKVISKETIRLLAGGSSGFVDADDGKSAKFVMPRDITMDKSGVFYVCDTGNHAVRKVWGNGKTLTIAGNGTPGNAMNVRASKYTATFNEPVGIAVDAKGDLFVLDTIANKVIKKITPEGWVYRFSGSGATGKSLGSHDPANGYTYSDNCSYQNIQGCDVDESGNLYLIDMGWPVGGAWGRLLRLDQNGRPFVVADFNALTYDVFAYDVVCTPGQKLYVVFSDEEYVEMSSSSNSSSSESSPSSQSSSSSSSSSEGFSASSSSSSESSPGL